jgi:ubiquinone/menaquinone biosynthesis C-methylase UbiE
MSEFENYHEISRHYDLTRVPVGLEIITKALGLSPTPLANQTLLDAGCGTGAYAATFVSSVKGIVAIDINSKMLVAAQSRVNSAKSLTPVSFCRAAIDTLPLASGTVDAIMLNQVLHHLGDSARTSWTKYRKVFSECARILQPGGILIVNSCSHKQLERGFWSYSFIPEAVEMVKRFLPTEAVFEEVLCENGFTNIDREVPYSDVLQGERYFDIRGILDPSWRDGDSIWSLVPEMSLRAVLAEVNQLLQLGHMDEFMRHADRQRPLVGQTTFTIAQRGDKP